MTLLDTIKIRKEINCFLINFDTLELFDISDDFAGLNFNLSRLIVLKLCSRIFCIFERCAKCHIRSFVEGCLYNAHGIIYMYTGLIRS